MGDPIALARIPEGVAFVDALDLGGRPHVVVDGPPLPGTAMCLSHWPQASTPAGLEADTSAGIVDRYLDCEARGAVIDAVTNNHYDEDGVLAIWLLQARPSRSDPRRAFAVAAAEAGDFHTWRDPSAAQAAITLMALAERATTPLPEVLRALSDPSGRDPAGAITAAVLGRVGRVLDDPGRYARLWGPRWERVAADRDLLASGVAAIEERPELDLAIVRAPRPLDPFACYPLTPATRVLRISPGATALVYRYETWVSYCSRELAPRLDLTPLASRLSAIEPTEARWAFDGVEAMTPTLSPRAAAGGRAPTGIADERLVDEVVAFLSGSAREGSS